jgi:hypothetical protein
MNNSCVALRSQQIKVATSVFCAAQIQDVPQTGAHLRVSGRIAQVLHHVEVVARREAHSAQHAQRICSSTRRRKSCPNTLEELS